MPIHPMADDSARSAALPGLAQRLGQLLALLGMTQAALARQIGASPGFVSDVIRGVKRPGADMFLGLRNALGVSIDWLLTGEGTMFGGSFIRPDMFRAIRLQIAVARAAIVEKDPVALALLAALRDANPSAAAHDTAFSVLLARIDPTDADLNLAVELYNGQQWTPDPISRRRNILAAATAHFEVHKPVDPIASLTDAFD